MAFITPTETDNVSRKEEKSNSEIKEEEPDEDSESESSEQEGVIERRAATRHLAHREAHLLFIASPIVIGTERPSHPLIGHTSDISETGLSLVVTSTHLNDYDLCEAGHLLRVKLSLPSGIAEMNARVVRSEWLNEENPRQGYFVGVRIEEISNEDRGRYTVYLSTL